MLNILSSKKYFFLSVLVGILTGLSWLCPDTFLSALLGFSSAFIFIILMKGTEKISYFFLSGIILNSIGFFWLFNTIYDFGQFNIILSLIGFSLFVLFSSTQFLLLPIIYKILKKSCFLNSLCLTGTLSFIFLENLFPKLFPWSLGHTQLYFKSFSLNASLGGVVLISFFMLWTCEFFINFFNKESRKKISKFSYFSPAFFIALIFYGNYLLNKKENYPNTNISIVQAVPLVESVQGMNIIKADIKKYENLTKKLTKELSGRKENSLIIWPESVITDWIYEKIKNVSENKKMPFWGNDYPLLTGVLSFNYDHELFNSVFLIGENGNISLPYHKQILIPFGEYIPFVNIFPFLKKLLNMEEFFTRGKVIRVFDYKTKDNKILKISPFICYEELIPSLFVKANNLGANLFVGISNDGWFEKEVALLQHNLISSFRAIENNRFFIRSTHTGVSTIIDNKGFVIAKLPINSNSYLTNKVLLIKNKTLYSIIGDIPLYLLNIFITILIFINIFKKSENI